jgi:hypothetical protein
MFHKNALPFPRSITSDVITTETNQTPANPARLRVVPPGGPGSQKSTSPLIDLITISAHRCASFFAEAAVLVLVLALLDTFLIRGSLSLRWIFGAFALSIMLLAASIATDFSARRWLQHH